MKLDENNVNDNNQKKKKKTKNVLFYLIANRTFVHNYLHDFYINIRFVYLCRVKVRTYIQQVYYLKKEVQRISWIKCDRWYRA